MLPMKLRPARFEAFCRVRSCVGVSKVLAWTPVQRRREILHGSRWNIGPPTLSRTYRNLSGSAPLLTLAHSGVPLRRGVLLTQLRARLAWLVVAAKAKWSVGFQRRSENFIRWLPRGCFPVPHRRVHDASVFDLRSLSAE